MEVESARIKRRKHSHYSQRSLVTSYPEELSLDFVLIRSTMWLMYNSTMQLWYPGTFCLTEALDEFLSNAFLGTLDLLRCNLHFAKQRDKKFLRIATIGNA